MRLTNGEKQSIEELEIGGSLKIEDYKRSDTYFEVQRVTESEWRVAEFAVVICLRSDYANSPQEVYKFIE